MFPSCSFVLEGEAIMLRRGERVMTCISAPGSGRGSRALRGRGAPARSAPSTRKQQRFRLRVYSRPSAESHEGAPSIALPADAGSGRISHGGPLEPGSPRGRAAAELASLALAGGP